MRVICLFLVLTGISLENLRAQSFYSVRRERSVIGSIGTGSATYLGDLKNPGLKVDAKLNINVGLQYFVSQRISLRGEVTWFHISGSDANATTDRRERNLSFFADNFEANVSGLVNFFPNRGGRFYRRVPLNFYGFVGIGFMYMNPKTTYQGKSVALQPLQTEGVKYSKLQPIIPYGLGIRIKQGPYLNICLEGGYRMTFTDYMDDVSSLRYPDPSKLSGMQLALSDRRRELDPDYVIKPNLGKRGNPKNNDGYFLLNVKIEYYLPYEISFASGKKFKIYNPKKTFDFNKRKYRRR